MAKRDLLKEAIADAEDLKKLATANAKQVILETFGPQIEDMVSKKLSEDADESDEDLDEVKAEDQDATEDEPKDDDKESDDDVDEVINIDAILKEIEDEDKDDDSKEDDSKEDVDEAKKKKDEEPYTEHPSKDEEDLDEEIDLSQLLSELSEDGAEDDDDDKDDDGDEKTQAEVDEAAPGADFAKKAFDKIKAFVSPENLKKAKAAFDEIAKGFIQSDAGQNGLPMNEKVQELQQELQESKKKVATLVSKVNEVNTMNASLLYYNKILKEHDLNAKQKIRILKQFDDVKTINEAKLVYKTLSEAFKSKPAKTSLKEAFGGSASGASGVSTRQTSGKNVIDEATKNRWSELVFGNRENLRD